MELEELYAELEKAKEVDIMVVHPQHYNFSKFDYNDIQHENQNVYMPIYASIQFCTPDCR